MDYYEKKLNAYQHIKRMIEKKKEIDIISIKNHIEEVFGFGDRFVMKYLKMKEEMGYIKIKDNIIKLVEIKKNE